MFGRTENWNDCLGQVPRSWRVSIPELPVFEGPARYTGVHGLAQYVLETMDASGVQHAVMGGNSLGGHVALQTALDAPHRVAGLILTGSSGLFERSIVSHVPRHPTRPWVRSRVQEVFLDARHAREEIIDEVLRIVSDRRKAIRLLKVAKSTKQTNLGPELHRIRCPVLLVWGEQDQVTPPDVAHQFKALMPQAELHFVPACGHVPMIEQPVEFGRLLGGFLHRLHGLGYSA